CGAATRAWAQAEDDLREGDRYFEEGEWRKAASAYDRAIRQFPRQVAAEAYAKRATIYIILKDYKAGLCSSTRLPSRCTPTRRRCWSKRR
ncbi:MAG: hypothetical protein HC863_00725, partial [Myxococcales bacterium]|nr:hypothetical protein [Myxococcales bacterium]